MEMKKNPHCLILPYPLQGHINPMLQFSKRLSRKGLSITLAITKRFLLNSSHHFSAVPTETISDGYDDGFPPDWSLITYLSRFEQVGRESLAALLNRLRESGRAVDCVVYGAFLPWAMAVAKECGAVGAPFLTQSCGVNNVYYMVWKGELKVPVLGGGIRVCGLPELEVSDVPSFLRDRESFPGSLELLLSQFDDAQDALFVFVNSVLEVEEEATNWLSKFLPVRTIGPTIPSTYLDNRIPNDKGYGLNIFEPDTSCLKWLDNHQARSVIYVAFGSIAKFQSDQMLELWEALKMTKKPFLWVVRSSEQSKLPDDAEINGTIGFGLIVPWCPQLEVLAHENVGCFVTHCGWNSTLEGLSLGMPMVGIPWWSDQSTNAKLVMDVWGIGVKANADREGVVRKDEIVRCLEHVMEGERADTVWKNVRTWKEVVKRAVDEGGSSDKNIEEFVSKLRLLPQK